MGSMQTDSDFKNELNDSGFAQDEPMMKKQSLENGLKPQLLDLSDDVLLYVLQYCDPRDLKSLGFTCTRLASLVLDRTLWERVDARSQPVGPERLRWYMKNALTSNTTELLLSGYAKEAQGCLGHMNCEYKESEKKQKSEADNGVLANGEFTYDPSTRRGIIRGGPVIQIYDTMPSFLDAVYGPPRGDDPACVAVLVSGARGNTVHIRATCFPLSDAFGPDIGPGWAPPDSSCPGPQYTLTPGLLRDLVALCPAITSLALEYCNIDCTTRNIGHFPRTLKKLSLRGSKCYNQPLDKSFLFKIQDYLTKLEELNVSECDWIEPSSLLPLSKLPSLQRLYMRRCCKMTECVAYSSLATRYGFKRLQVIDLRESPVGDSEVSSFGWVSSLEELYVSPAPTVPQVVHHAHYIGDVLPKHIELDPWEEEEPEYFKSKQQKPKHPDLDKMDEDNSNTLKRKINSPVVCSCGAKNADEIAPKKPKPGVNEGASTSKWTSTEDPPPLRYFDQKSPEKSGSEAKTESVMDSSELSGALELSQTTESSGTAESGGSATLPESPGNTQSDMESSSCELVSGSAESAGALESLGATKSLDTESPSTSQSETTVSPGTSKSETTEWPSTSQSKTIESPGTSQSEITVSRRTSQSETTKSPSTSQSETTESPSTSQSETTKPPHTTRSPPRNTDSPRPGTSNQEGKLSFQRYIRFRQNQNPVVVDRPEEETNRNQEPVHKILYVNVGRRLHTMYRLTMPMYAFGDNELMGENARRLDGPFATPRFDPRTLVSDTTVHHFGRADSDNISYINIGPNGIQHESPGTRPDRSNLRVLSMTGFRNITNRSLVHLATAAPMLRLIDFTGTRVTERGVVNFRSLRPDCEVIFDRDM